MEAVRVAVVVLTILCAAQAQGQVGAHWSKPQALRVPGKPAVTILVVRFADDGITSEKVLAAMRERNVRPANDEHCAAYAARMDGLFVCLGSVKVVDGQKVVRAFYTRRGLKEKEFIPWNGRSRRSLQFLAVQK